MEECWSLVPLVTHCPRSGSRSLWRPITSTVTDAVSSLVRLLCKMYTLSVFLQDIHLVSLCKMYTLLTFLQDIHIVGLCKRYTLAASSAKCNCTQCKLILPLQDVQIVLLCKMYTFDLGILKGKISQNDLTSLVVRSRKRNIRGPLATVSHNIG